MRDDPNSVKRAAFTVNEFLEWARISRSTFYKEVAAGKIEIRKVGGRSLVLRANAENWLNSLPLSSELPPPENDIAARLERIRRSHRAEGVDDAA